MRSLASRTICFLSAVKISGLFDEAEQWITTPGGEWMFSFDNVCESLGFNPEYVRRGLLRWKKASAKTVCQRRSG